MKVALPQPFPPVLPQPERASRFYSLAEHAGRPVPPREWLVHDLVPMRQVTLLTGDGGTGKSLLALQLAVAVAAAGPWLGRDVRPDGAIFLSAEDDDDELHRRAADVLRASGLDFAAMQGLTMRSLAGEDALLAMEGQLRLVQTALFDELAQRAADEAPGLVVIDTAADTFPANENDRRAVRQFIGILRGLAIRQRCAVMLLSHPSLTGLASGSGTSGSTAWSNSVRSRLYLSRIADDRFEPDPDKRVLAVKKLNYGRTGGEIGLTWRDGVFWPDGPSAEGHLERLTAGAKAERVFLELLGEMTEQGRFVSASPSNSFAPSLFAAHPAAEGVTNRAFKSAMESLLQRRVIVVATHGKGRNERKHIALKHFDITLRHSLCA